VREGRGAAGERGQATVEWTGLLWLVSLLLVGLLATAAARLPATDLPRAIAARLICAVRLSDACSAHSELVAAYGPELGAQIAAEAPEIVYEDGMTALPVDFRACRRSGCGNGSGLGAVWTSDTGQPAAAFVHVVDCRSAEARGDSAARGHDCSEERAGNLYIQYWLYYEDSTSLRTLPGRVGFHEDDWEGYQARIGPSGTEARATSHQGYNYDGGLGGWPSDAGLVHRSAWGPSTGRLYVSGGSHAGHVHEDRRLSVRKIRRASAGAGAGALAALRGDRTGVRLPRRLTAPPPRTRWTPADRLTLIPIETLDPAARRTRFAVVPPWRKPVYHDPEDQGT
jgi:hypothetical protein